ncbi:tRNA (guanine-N(7)-)-methyltransferase non-catalytic subunit wuho [Aricia agestis]|uniref:tRNA (guanine-N(7)-)-methyltransferase non-catalytic subunit wuho n=1 Tax=Aricia agestis TaxID=91739 RepID=UPI001C20AA47|nr:tRNA (guanine-N(7)-)-methyltransferase non-catalytic subunit wuho [Aricia agestis]
MSLIAASDLLVAVCKNNLIDCFDSKKHYVLQCDTGSEDSITDIVISSDNKHIAVITSTSKKLLIYDSTEFKSLKTFTLPRSASKIRFGANNTHIFVADKTGDVLLYDIMSEDNGTKILGHLSLLLNVLQTNDGKYVITSDRDEKIKVSHFPNTYNIQTYCLGHTEFVNHIEILPHDNKYLISASGDGTIKCWDYLSGKLCYSFNTDTIIDNVQLKEDFKKVMDSEGVEVNNLPIVHFDITGLPQARSLFAVSIHTYNKLILCSLNSANDNFTHKIEKELAFDFCPTQFKFIKNSLLVYNDINLNVLKYSISSQDDNIDVSLDSDFKVFENESIKPVCDSELNSIKVMFKRKFDNVQEYQERKKQRLAKGN